VHVVLGPGSTARSVMRYSMTTHPAINKRGAVLSSLAAPGTDLADTRISCNAILSERFWAFSSRAPLQPRGDLSAVECKGPGVAGLHHCYSAPRQYTVEGGVWSHHAARLSSPMAYCTSILFTSLRGRSMLQGAHIARSPTIVLHLFARLFTALIRLLAAYSEESIHARC
jgi:hypothetical protein